MPLGYSGTIFHVTQLHNTPSYFFFGVAFSLDSVATLLHVRVAIRQRQRPTIVQHSHTQTKGLAFPLSTRLHTHSVSMSVIAVPTMALATDVPRQDGIPTCFPNPVATATVVATAHFPNKETYVVPRWSPMFAMHGYMWSIVVLPPEDVGSGSDIKDQVVQLGLLLQPGSLQKLPPNAQLHCTFDMFVNHKVEGLSTVTERAQSRGVQAVMQQATPCGQVLNPRPVVTETSPLAIAIRLTAADLEDSCCCLDTDANIHVTVVMAEPPTVSLPVQQKKKNQTEEDAETDAERVPSISPSLAPRDLDDWDLLHTAHMPSSGSDSNGNSRSSDGNIPVQPITFHSLTPQTTSPVEPETVEHPDDKVKETSLFAQLAMRRQSALRDEWYPLQGRQPQNDHRSDGSKILVHTTASMYACLIYVRHGPANLSVQVDVVQLVAMFTSMGWDFDVFPVANREDINAAMDLLVHKDYASYDGMSVFIAGTGKHNCLELPDQSLFNVGATTLYGYFTPTQCPTLCGKPKLIFVQASRNRDTAAKQWCNPGAVERGGRLSYHDSKDCLVMYATTSGSDAWTNTLTGSWLYDTLIALWQESWLTQDVQSMLQDVSRCVNARSITKDAPHEPVQVPQIISTLTRRLRLSSTVRGPRDL